MACRVTAQADSINHSLDMTLNPNVAALRPSKTMMLSDLASSLRESGVDVVSFAAGEPDFDTPDQILEAGIEALRCLFSPILHKGPCTAHVRHFAAARACNRSYLMTNHDLCTLWQQDRHHSLHAQYWHGRTQGGSCEEAGRGEWAELCCK